MAALEVIEHVEGPREFVAMLGRLLKPGGLLFLATIDRTTKSYLLAIVAAEYVLGWVPKGTHNHDKFIRPDELSSWVRQRRHAGDRSRRDELPAADQKLAKKPRYGRQLPDGGSKRRLGSGRPGSENALKLLFAPAVAGKI